jgi:hypothetical protein
MMKPFLQIKVGKGRSKDDNHPFPHGADPQHVPVVETLNQKINDSDVPEDSEKEVLHLMRLGVILDVKVSKNFDNRHETHIQNSHLFSVDKLK